jgi:hypothetical protein
MNNNKTCQGCGVEFKPNSSTQRFCSNLCWLTSAEKRAITREVMHERWRDPKFQTLISEMMRECWQQPKYRVSVIEALKAAKRKQ